MIRNFNGMVLDTDPSNQPEGTYRYAWNKVVNLLNSTIADEYGTDLVSEYDGTVLGVCVIDFYKTVIFRNDSINVLENGTETVIIKDASLNIQEPLKAIGFKNYKGENIVVWTDGINNIRFLNLDNPEPELDNDKGFVSSKDLKKLDFFPSFEVPKISAIEVNDFGGNIKSGVVSFALAYQTKDGFITDFAFVSNPVPIYKDSYSFPFHKVGGSKPGTPTQKSLEANIEDLDDAYEKVVIAVIHRYETSEDTYIAAILDIPESRTIRFTFTGEEFVESLEIEEILISRAKYKTAKTLTLANNEILFGNLTTRERVDLQEVSSNIEVKWVYEDPVRMDTVKDSYKDGSVLFMDKSFMPGEVYALFIAYYIEGKRTEAFHIPGRSVRVVNGQFTESDLINQLVGTSQHLEEDAKIDEDVRYFHTRDTSSADGTMGYWENEEVYPSWFGSLAGQKVRHHRFPSMSKLQQYGKVVLDNVYNNEVFVSYVNYAFPTGFNAIDDEYFTKENESRVTVNYTGKLTLRTTYAIGNNQLGESAYLKINVFDGTIPVFEIDEYGEYLSSNGERSFTIDVQEGYSITVNYDGNVETLDVFVGFRDEAIQLESYAFTKKLGIKVSGIQLPENLQGKIEGYELFYAKRSYTNATVIGYSPLFLDTQEAINTVTPAVVKDSKLRLYHPDILANETFPSVPLTYLSKELVITGNPKMIDYQTRKLIQQYNGFEDDKRIINVDQVLYEPYVPDTMRETALTAVSKTLSHQTPYNGIIYVSMMAFRKNVYPNFILSDLISTGKINKMTDQNTNIYGGDCVSGEYSFWRSKFVEPVEQNGVVTYDPTYCFVSKVLSWFTYSAINHNLRYEGENFGEKYHPKSSIPTSFGGNFTIEHCCLVDNFVAIDPLTKKLNIDHGVVPFNKSVDYQSSFPNRIIKGSIITSEGTGAEARKFLLFDYYELNKAKGQIVNLEWYGRKLLIHTEDCLFVAGTDTQLQTEDYSVILGAGKLFSVPPEEVLSAEGGYAGTQHLNSCKLTKVGYFFVDDRRSKVFLFGEGLTEISNSGMREFIKENSFSSYGETHPRGYAVGYDDQYNRILLTKFRGEDSEEYTISYSIESQKWVSFHSYHPRLYFTNANRMHSVVSNRLYMHNVKDFPLTFYGTRLVSFVDLVYSLPAVGIFSAFKWKTLAITKDGDELPEKTFDRVMVYSEKQSSGEVETENNVRSLDSNWRFNNFRDLIDPQKRGEKFIDQKGLFKISNLDQNMDWKIQKRFIGTWVILRLISDNSGDYVLYLQSSDVGFRKAY